MAVANKHFSNAISDHREFPFHVSYEEVIARVSQILHTFKRTPAHLLFCSKLKSLIKDVRVKEQIQRDIIADSVQSVRRDTVASDVFCSSCKNRIYLSAVLCKCSTRYLCVSCYLSEEHECNCKQSEKSLISYKSTDELKLPSSVLRWLQHYTRWKRKVSAYLDTPNADVSKSAASRAPSNVQAMEVDKEASENRACSAVDHENGGTDTENVDEMKTETQSVLSESNDVKEEIKSCEFKNQKVEYTKPSLEDLRSSLAEAKKSNFTTVSVFLS